MKFIFPILFFALLSLNSCKKDYVCVCTKETSTAAIYYLNKVETAKISTYNYSNHSLNSTKKNAASECSKLNEAEQILENETLASGRTGGQISVSTTCQIN